MDNTTISWTQGPNGEPGATWNPTDGCDVCSPGCKNCYAMRIAGRFSRPGFPYHGLVTISKKGKAVWNGEGRLNKKALPKPLHWRRPRGVFVDSMSDLFFEVIENEEIAACFGVMAAANWHRYMILTKRAKRMVEWYRWLDDTHGKTIMTRGHTWDPRASGCWDSTVEQIPTIEHSTWHHDFINRAHLVTWPMPHIWQGVSVDDRKHGLPRIDYLRQVNAALRWLSIEPLLEDLGELDLSGISWVVIGCESGPGARACETDWLLSIIEQCKAQNVPVWLKQAEHTPGKFLPGMSATLEIGADDGSKIKGKGPRGGRIVELPYINGKQYRELPQ